MNYNSRKFASAMSVVVLLGLTACGGDDSGSGSDTAGDSTATTELAASAPAMGGVTIAGFGFNTGSGVTAGQEFTITNDDPASHTFTDVGGTFSVSLSGGQEVTLTIDTPGDYQVVCEIHGDMSGTLTVK